MKKNKIIPAVTFMLLFNTLAYANSAPTYWTGYPSGDIMAIDKNTPIMILNENLLFDFTGEHDSSYSPSASVSAVYEMQNSSNEHASVQMAFPFIKRFDESLTDDIIIKADDEVISYNTYIGSRVEEADEATFNIEQIVKSISDKKYTAENFEENETGKLYRINASSASDKINLALSFNFDREKTRVITKGFNRFERNDDNVRISFHIMEKEEHLIYILGEDIKFDIKGYTNGTLAETTESFEYEVTAEEIDLETYFKKHVGSYDNMESSHISDIQLYNFYAESLDKYLGYNLGICSESDIMSGIWTQHIIILVYTVDFPQNSKKEVSVSYNTIGTMNRRKTPEPQFTYDYILNPAKNWKEFNNLNIKIMTPQSAPYVVNSSIELKKASNGIYTAYLDELPEEDFFFTLYSKEKITWLDRARGYLNRKFGYFAPLVIGFAVTVLLIIVFAAVKGKRTKNNIN